MFCTNCGQKVPDSARFCTNCGAPLASDPGASPFDLSVDNGYGQDYVQPKPPKSALRLLLAIAGGAVLLFLCIFGISRLFMTPKNTVGLAAKKTVKAYTDAAKSLSNFDAQKLLGSKAFSQEITIQGINDLAGGEYSFDGFRLRSDVNLPKRYIGLTGSVLDRRSAMFTVRAAIDDNLAAANVPELLDDDFWAVNTQTLGADLSSSVFGLQASDYADVSFNFFDLLDEAAPSEEFGDASGKALWEAVTAEKTGKQELRIDGESYSCTSYRVLIPQTALEAYVNDYFACLGSASGDNLQSILADCGFPVEPTSSYARDDSDGYAVSAAASPLNSARESILNALDTLGDIELTTYVSGGYLCGVDWSPSDDAYSRNMLLSIRTGGKNHTDYFSLSFENYGSELFLESSGNHSAKGGAFTDSTYMEVDGDLVFSWECSYAPKGSGSNFSASLHVPEAYPELSLSLDGRIESDSKTLNIDLEDISVDLGNTRGRMSFAYVLSSFEKAFDVSSPVMILELDQDELTALGQEIATRLLPYEDLLDEMI